MKLENLINKWTVLLAAVWLICAHVAVTLGDADIMALPLLLTLPVIVVSLCESA